MRSHWIPDVKRHGEFLIALTGELPLPLTVIIDLAAQPAVLPPKPFHWLNRTHDDLVARVSGRNRDDFNVFIRAIDAATGIEGTFWHFHVRKCREYLFQADDMFKRGFIRIDSFAVSEPWLDDLKERGIITSYSRCKGSVG